MPAKKKPAIKKDKKSSKVPIIAKKPRKPAKKTKKSPTKPKVTKIESLTKLSFYASLEETKMRQSATTLDNSYTLKVKTNDFNIMDLGKLPPLTLLRITVEVIDDRDRVKPDEERDAYYS